MAQPKQSKRIGIMDAQVHLTRAILWLILIAALISAPIFLIAEEFDSRHILLVLGSNGICVLMCVGLLHRLKRGDVQLCARLLVFGLLLLVAGLATTNGESVHVNVVNFILVSVLAAVLLGRKLLLTVAALCALTMLWIAWNGTVPRPGEELFEARLEAIVQFMPTYLVVVAILWLREQTADPVAPDTYQSKG